MNHTNLIHRLIVLAAILIRQMPLEAQPHLSAPIGLMTDLLAYPDYQSAGGYPVQPFWSAAAFQLGQSVRISSQHPAFSWALPTGKDAITQIAYRILLASHPDSLAHQRGDYWDSGQVSGSSSTAIIYQGKALQPRTLYFWKVQIWAANGQPSSFSTVSAFYTDSVLSDCVSAHYPLQKTDQLPIVIKKTGTSYQIDFGKAAFGQLKLTLTALADGDTVNVHLGEAAQPNGNLNRKPGGNIRYQQYRLPLRAGTHTYQVQIKPDGLNTRPAAAKMPAYIGEVLPFRYVELENYVAAILPGQVVRTAVNYPFNEEASSFSSSDTILNAVWELCKYSTKATTFAGIYVDGDRERLPYEADAYINQLCHYATDREYSLARYSQEHLLFHATWPTEWILQSVLMAWNDYLYTGDIRYAQHYYEELKAKTLTDLEGDNGLISTCTGKQTKAFIQRIHFNGDTIRDIVDWPHSGILGLAKGKGGETDGFVFNNYNAVVNAYYYKALLDISALAASMGKTDDAAFYSNKAASVKKAFQQIFWDKKQQLFCDGEKTRHASLHTNMFALTFGLAEEKQRASVTKFVRSRGMACSVYGSQFLMDAIYEGGDAEYGLSLLHSQELRSWYNMIRAGSTITMEAWDNQFKPNQDWNHIWGAVPANIIPRKLMGVEPLTPGWDEFRIKPQIGSLAWATIKVPTIKGAVEVSVRQEAGHYQMTVCIPGNTKAHLVLPGNGKKQSVTINGQPVKTDRKGDQLILPVLGGGEYEVQYN
ncbi:alpha-L-rhamnosidase [bacterium A37T11]|nr:alpha-L-rhamnosidase [bacterium A37T11]